MLQFFFKKKREGGIPIGFNVDLIAAKAILMKIDFNFFWQIKKEKWPTFDFLSIAPMREENFATVAAGKNATLAPSLREVSRLFSSISVAAIFGGGGGD
jgi:hypothetical protein